jgi:hypothetical protein
MRLKQRVVRILIREIIATAEEKSREVFQHALRNLRPQNYCSTVITFAPRRAS